jgi:hypothetical protein
VRETANSTCWLPLLRRSLTGKPDAIKRGDSALLIEEFD